MSARVFTVQSDSMAPEYPVNAEVLADDIDPNQIRPGYAYIVGTSTDEHSKLCRVLRISRKSITIGFNKSGRSDRVRRSEIVFAALVYGIKRRGVRTKWQQAKKA